MENTYTTHSLVEIDREISAIPKKVTLRGSDITIADVLSVSDYAAPVVISTNPKVIERVQKCYNKMLKDVKNGIPIYGCNTGYGARASRVLNEGSEEQRVELARQISEGIAHVDVTTGPRFDKEITRGAMLIRINALMRGFSAVKLEDLEIYKEMLNQGITPIVNQYGGIGASGDLAHNCRILSAARQLDGVKVWDKDGNEGEAKTVLSAAGIPALELDPKAGLGLVNGDNYSTSLATHLTVDTLHTLLISQVVGSLAIEALMGTNRSFHPLLAEVRPHEGQREVAELYRYLLNGSKLAYQEMKGHQLREKGIKVQDGYSLRGISQYHGVNFEKIKRMLDMLTVNFNSVSDNPLWVPDGYETPGEKPWQWVSGANFIAMHMAYG
jgi:histidine ammonia-lyase